MGVFLTLMGLLGGCGTCCSTNAFLIGVSLFVYVCSYMAKTLTLPGTTFEW
ncbi:hypothetical protein FSP39_023520 [Pinctada imbricata]|uniref:Uncharacterized protein n=1 Tax=Pinctada imbricata TaxID=66713 RepID=A0AA88YL87_PINIB|nr:hypothetical protein FSP39_023520 [Pinctada imbricata]